MEYQEKEWLDAIDVYSQYFHASYTGEGTIRKAAIVRLTVLKDSEGLLEYQISASFMPYEDEEDFRVPEDVRFETFLSYGAKRRNKKLEAEYLSQIREKIDQLLPEQGKILWDQPLRDARFG